MWIQITVVFLGFFLGLTLSYLHTDYTVDTKNTINFLNPTKPTTDRHDWGWSDDYCLKKYYTEDGIKITIPKCQF